MAITAREEFGFSGDEGYHLSATRAFALYFMRAGPFLIGALVVFGVLRFKRFTLRRDGGDGPSAGIQLCPA